MRSRRIGAAGQELRARFGNRRERLLDAIGTLIGETRARPGPQERPARLANRGNDSGVGAATAEIWPLIRSRISVLGERYGAELAYIGRDGTRRAGPHLRE
jgi:hypothetical protein